MARCTNCGKDHDKSFEIHRNGEKHTFDSFECAIHLLAPVCAHCGYRIIRHGIGRQHVLLRFLHATVRGEGSEGQGG